MSIPECSSAHTDPNTQQGQTTLLSGGATHKRTTTTTSREAVKEGVDRDNIMDASSPSAQNSFDDELCEWFDSLPKPPEPLPWLPQEKATDRHPFD